MSGYFVSIVSHGHDELIMQNENWTEISALPDVTIIIKDNLSSEVLKEYCHEKGFVYLSTPEVMGFGHNNNYNFSWAQQHGISHDGWFLVINPDVIIECQQFERMTTLLKKQNGSIFTVNLFKDEEYTVSEDSLRYFPNINSLMNLFARKPVTKSYSKESLTNLAEVEWASGAFLVFSSDLYAKLQGFDVRFFMYYEDVDICFRAQRDFDTSVKYLSEVYAVHEGAYRNRNLFSKHFYWYLGSLLKFLIGSNR
ncbi:glycosyltransferase family 2 protein [Vibrio sp. SCSIO 43140]|uniref:hypothetical protein n=1 Tax=Vibrio sp. SCSIO 43140 TaxID=2819100 RepID=UPI002074B44B|nr:hypothetical protein [Vibrio sp. SCSIO 43140]USD60239.1 glycosyltransferase family 2 protein [Vibrio sp. SCSIO 43140]